MRVGEKLHSLRLGLVGLPRSAKTLVLILADLAGFMLSALVASWLVVGWHVTPMAMLSVALIATFISILVAYGFGFYNSVVRYMGDELVAASAMIMTPAAFIGAGVTWYLGLELAPFRWGLTYASLGLVYCFLSRVVASHLLNTRQRAGRMSSVVIYGAGEAGVRLARQLRHHADYHVAAFIDDDPARWLARVAGLKVYGVAELPRLIDRHALSSVLLAVPSASRARRREIISSLAEYPIELRTMPAIEDIVSGQAQVDDLRSVSVTELLGREPVPPDEALLSGTITGKSVMITGAGGSIGSELCRQALALRPTKLVLFELSEPALYEIEQEMLGLKAELDSDCQVVALLGSVVDRNRVLEVMQTFAVQTVFHAAAYKHVPLVEMNLLEGVSNNVLGTWNTACAAVHAGVSTFLLVSTDKAVRPTNVMGATKRFAELCLQALQEQTSHTKFSMVRFGNVLDSSGSVIPLFRRQIRDGGPVTVTHPEIIRYFMTIPEAAQLVIQAASMGSDGDVFVLDMGSPIKIDTLARQMIKLTGLTIKSARNPDGDIEIIYTGLRPAEKLFEELLLGEGVTGTDHPRIMRAHERRLSVEELQASIKELEFLLAGRDCGQVRDVLIKTVKSYTPSNGIEDRVCQFRAQTSRKEKQLPVIASVKPVKSVD